LASFLVHFFCLKKFPTEQVHQQGKRHASANQDRESHVHATERQLYKFQVAVMPKNISGNNLTSKTVAAPQMVKPKLSY